MTVHRISDRTERLIQSDAFRRSDGPLSPQELIDARAAGVLLQFDPMQNGWVRADATDDICANLRRPGWPTTHAVLSRPAEVSLRAWHARDAAQFRALLDNPAVWRFLPQPYPGPISLQTARDLIALSNDPQLHTVQAILSDGMPVGQVRLEHGEQDPELSYWLGQPYWGKGIGSKAVTAFAGKCFESDPGLDHMIARAKPQNAASLRILEKAGFIREGRSNTSPDWVILRCDRPA